MESYRIVGVTAKCGSLREIHKEMLGGTFTPIFPLEKGRNAWLCRTPASSEYRYNNIHTSIVQEIIEYDDHIVVETMNTTYQLYKT